MISEKDPKQMKLQAVRCSECDREMTHYNTFVSPTNEEKVICWQCLAREEKGFNARRDFRREARTGYIPR
jgi:formylmethanofuran dehydrogenase subunit E